VHRSTDRSPWSRTCDPTTTAVIPTSSSSVSDCTTARDTAASSIPAGATAGDAAASDGISAGTTAGDAATSDGIPAGATAGDAAASDGIPAGAATRDTATTANIPTVATTRDTAACSAGVRRRLRLRSGGWRPLPWILLHLPRRCLLCGRLLHGCLLHLSWRRLWCRGLLRRPGCRLLCWGWGRGSLLLVFIIGSLGANQYGEQGKTAHNS
jgi:hypothetical protein